MASAKKIDGEHKLNEEFEVKHKPWTNSRAIPEVEGSANWNILLIRLLQYVVNRF